MHNLRDSVNWDQLEFWAKAFCYPFVVLGALTFLLSNLSSFTKYGPWALWTYMIVGMLWTICLAFIYVRDVRRTRPKGKN